MSFYLSLSEIRLHQDEIKEEFSRLINNPLLCSRKKAQQWAFFRHCFNNLLKEAYTDFSCTEKQALNYKAEIKQSLLRYYQSFGKPVKFIFSLESTRKIGNDTPVEFNYPSNNGYILLICNNKTTPDSVQKKKLLIERTVEEAIKAEFEAYKKLPVLDFSELEKYFDANSSAYKYIRYIAEGTNKRNWTLKNPDNCSTARLIKFKIENLDELSAQVKTKEFWRLMWWNSTSNNYQYQYKEEIWQYYFLEWKDNKWIIIDTAYLYPKNSTPKRTLRALENRN